MLHTLIDMEMASHEKIDVLHLAKRTAGMVLGDLRVLISYANRAAYHRILASW